MRDVRRIGDRGEVPLVALDEERGEALASATCAALIATSARAASVGATGSAAAMGGAIVGAWMAERALIGGTALIRSFGGALWRTRSR